MKKTVPLGETWLDQAPTPVVGLAPMDGVSDPVYRRLLVKVARPDFLFTEFISAEGLSRGALKLFEKLFYFPSHQPIVAQLFGKTPEDFYKATFVLADLGFAGIDLNMGCPAKKVVSHGGGASLIEKPALATQIVKSCRQALDDWKKDPSLESLNFPSKTLKTIALFKKENKTKISYSCPTLSVKTRLGIDKPILSSWLPVLLDLPLDFITLHARTLSQGYSGQANWDQITLACRLAKKSQIPIFGNGDVKSRENALLLSQKYPVRGFLIGRAAWAAPWVFAKTSPTTPERVKIILDHLHLYQNFSPPPRQFPGFKKHLAKYLSGFPAAARLRTSLLLLETPDKLEKALCEIISKC